MQHAKADGTVIAGYQYTRDGVGNPAGVALADGDLITFTHDDNYRLTREQRSGANAYDITYTFDAVGNRSTKLSGGVTTTYTFNEADRLTVENAGGTLTTYSWDAAGNNTVANAVGTLTTYTWDLANRLTAANASGALSTFAYDATGLRRTKQDASGTTRFLWDGQTLLLEADAGGTTQAHYSAAPGGYGPLVAQRRGTTSRFYHPTDLGTIENLTDASGNVTDTYVLDAWGVQVASSGSTTNPHRYVGALGYQADPALGLTYVRARYLWPATGSWLSVDPVLSEPRYLYVGSSPVQRVDAGGRDEDLPTDSLDHCISECNSRFDDSHYLRRACCDVSCRVHFYPDNGRYKMAAAACWRLLGNLVQPVTADSVFVHDLQVHFPTGAPDNNHAPWCGMFAWWCGYEAGYWPWEKIKPTGGQDNLAAVGEWRRWAEEHDWIRDADGAKPADPADDYRPLPGDLFIRGESGHIGVVIGTQHGQVVTIEGNTSCETSGSCIWYKRHPIAGGDYGITSYIHLPERF